MQIVRGTAELIEARAALRAQGSLALVPTMGALHAGHMALVAEARRRADKVAVSIFVNPAQFGPSEDFASYPRREADDLAMLEEARCDLVWLPGKGDVYPDGFATTISVGSLSRRWEGEARPGHFDGVATIVAKLLLAVAPDVALFGEKDFQQLAVIRQLTGDLGIPVEIVGVATIREADGVALSSRNAYLTAADRISAAALPQALETAREAIETGSDVAQTLASARHTLAAGGFSHIDYFALVDAQSLEPLNEPAGEMRLLAAAKIGTTRLIDNVPVRTKSPRR